MNRLFRGLLASALALSLALPALAQERAPAQERVPAQAGAQAEQRQTGGRQSGERSRPANLRLPADSVTRHTLTLPGRTLSFEATAGSVVLTDRAGKPEAEIAVVVYAIPDRDPATRPVTFVVNGGPGAASAYLHLGVLGPWRLPMGDKSIVPSQTPELVPNAETWLDFTDLVFIDPVGTGVSRLVESTDELRQRYLSVEGDVEALADVISRWLRDNERASSPKYFVGESYGGFRGPLLAEKLQTDYGFGLRGLTLLSPVLDFGWREQPGYAPLPKVSLLPSLAAAALEKRGPLSREALREVERYAAGEFVTDLLLGLQNPEAVERVSRRVADLTGLDPALVKRLAGRVDMQTFAREIGREQERVASLYDTGVTSDDPTPNTVQSRFSDPVLEAMTAPLTSAMVQHLATTLNWKPDQRYILLNGGLNGAWRWGRGRSQPEAVSELRSVLALDPGMRVLVVHGFTDLVTPYFESELILRQIRDFGGRVRLEVYPGGHMFYNRDASRAAFRRDAQTLYGEAVEGRAPARPTL